MFKEHEENVVKGRYGDDVSSKNEYHQISFLKEIKTDTWVRKYNNENSKSLTELNDRSD